ncbi:MAG: alpha/beta hydrolase [Prevotellaceae bacterium]|jgi:predicted alpha/beta superfamily hydrolase|nr:alpha/beta hydrolase [Prevotellaceae bacterium]
MFHKVLFVIFGIAIFFKDASAQTDICTGKEDSIYSHALQEERTYWIHLPESYADSVQKKYSVIYLLDGDLFFHALVAAQRLYSQGRQPLMPECIIIGILNTDRTRDLTPSKSAYRRDGKRYDGDREIGGGSELFTSYLTDELRIKINKKYRTNNINIIVGHSFGGLFALNTLMYHPQLFDIYVVLDPSFWWDNGKIQKEADKLFETKQFNHIKLYLGIAAKIRPDANNINSNIAGSFINNILPKAIKNGLQVNYKIFSDESHGTVPIPGISDALKIIFQ